MWPRRLRLTLLDFHSCSWRRCITVLSTLLIVNTVFHWTLIDDVHTHPGQPGSIPRSTRDGGGGETPFRERVISINKWYDEIKGGKKKDDEELEFDADKGNYLVAKDAPVKESLITYITRKPSNRRPLGEVPTKNGRQVAEKYKEEREKKRLGRQENQLFLSSRSAFNESENLRKVETSRRQIDTMRERVQTRKREIRNRSLTETVEISFLRNQQTKQRTASKGKTNPNRDHVLKLIHELESQMDYAVIDVCLNEKIRYYSQPGWLDLGDIDAMNFMTSAWVLNRRQFAMPPSVNRLVLASNAEIERLLDNYNRKVGKVDTEMECQRAGTLTCQTAWCSLDLSLVVAFHLDRVIGLNVTPPTVGRELPVRTRHPPAMQHVRRSNEMQSSKFVLDDDLPVRVVALTVTSSRQSPKEPAMRGVLKDESPKSTEAMAFQLEHSSNLSEKLFIFCFILKIANCNIDMWTGYFNSLRCPQRHGDESLSVVPCPDACFNGSSPIETFQPSKSSSEGENAIPTGFNKLSSGNRALLHAGRIRQRLLQSLFLDRIFWAQAGGRRGIEELLNVIDLRINVLSEHLSIHSQTRTK